VNVVGGIDQVRVVPVPLRDRAGEDVAGEVGRRPAQDLVLLLQQLVAPDVLAGASPSSRSAIFSQRCRQVSEFPKSVATRATDASLLRATAITSRRNSGGKAGAPC